MAERMSLDNVLDEERPVPEPETPAEPPSGEPAEPARSPYESRRKIHREKEQTAQGKVRDETGRFVAKTEAAPEPAAPVSAEAPAAPATPATPAVPAQPEFTEREKAFLRTAQEERQKRQELERKYAQPQPPAAPVEPPKAFWEDPEGALKTHQEEIRSVAVNTRLQTAEMLARTRYTDFDEKVAKFAEILQSTPGLHQQWLSATDPAEFAYKTGANQLMIQQAGGFEAALAKARTEAAAEAKAKAEAEMKAHYEAEMKKRDSLPPSLSNARGAGAGNPVVWGGPTSLDSILK